ncbi:hypothetical protein COCC4DRAFT_29089 [Bipolaris maydis ATCC 48331]|uniref:Uncharacterized protein n=2 Tax=Cochliobolus heterostrophus TaxID=5016 RepID=M2TYB1_COCH5|nr:uncharacterized protein COCC4DRAFT_29089 [Bipolaris maydis ATCC 48331]EMD86786.1 hypothetical protein COCHEDRAFT_1034550 [Bipolaris maydis C5]KAJ5052500.1 hypothetical protein J3E74DRAFT_412029 [Bipolaris maydis]ENH98603.1 hypothetical protein COCC4DRAFT_29089 [Bipolaris maydis ATCC 48331]KAJ6192184.1 hypothetical protein J3E72DRAFT_379974 [Bipolaris maydis]KAJ6203643.1 hypothetical protein PSV09DRAFT_1034550 [Bipolaris maydis]
MHSQRSSEYPKPRASSSGYTLVQFDDNNFFILDKEELQVLGIKPVSGLPSFSPENHSIAIENSKLTNIKDRQCQIYGSRRCEVYIFRLNEEKDKRWLSKTNFKNKLGKNLENRDRTIDFMEEASTVTYAEYMKDREGSYDSNGDTEMADYSNVVESVEVPSFPNTGHTFQSSIPTSGQITSGKENTSRNSSPSTARCDSPGVSGETPEPRDGATVIYGINCKFGANCFKKRGLVYKNDVYDFEDIYDCPSNLMIPGQNGGMAPKVDDEFVSQLKISQRKNLKIVGCAAKWHGRPNNKKIVIVVLEIQKTDPLWKELKQKRRESGYRYEGPLVCKLSTYRKVFKEGDIPTLQDCLNMTQFAVDATETELSLEQKKQNEQPTWAKLSDQFEKIQDIMEKLLENTPRNSLTKNKPLLLSKL